MIYPDKLNENRKRPIPPTAWKPGVSGNPKGRPKKEICLTTHIKALLENNPELLEELARKWLDQALKGERDARRDLQNRIEGRVPLPIQGRIDGDLEINFSIGKGYESPKALSIESGAMDTIGRDALDAPTDE